jgi:uncharacterized membrane protein YcaP (DUF421 family)
MWNEMLKPEMWSGMLDHMLTPEISILEKMFRPVIVYMFLLISLRLAGKRELAQLNAMDLIVLLTLSNTVQNAIIGSDNSVSGGLIGAATLLGLNYFVVRFLFSHERIDRVVEGEPVTLIEGGRVMPDRMKKEFITVAELQAAAHKQGFSSLEAVDQAVLEPSGVMSFVGKQPPADEVRYGEITKRLDQISQQLDELRSKAAGPSKS